MTPKLQRLHDALVEVAGVTPVERLGELTLEVKAADYRGACEKLRDHPALRFEQLIDLCGVDYSTYGDRPWEKGRFAAVLHLLSVVAAFPAVLVVDETRRSGGVSEGVVTALVEGGYQGRIARVTAEDSFVPLGPAAAHVVLTEDDVVTALSSLA